VVVQAVVVVVVLTNLDMVAIMNQVLLDMVVMVFIEILGVLWDFPLVLVEEVVQ
jgi:hypothetical protein